MVAVFHQTHAPGASAHQDTPLLLDAHFSPLERRTIMFSHKLEMSHAGRESSVVHSRQIITAEEVNMESVTRLCGM